MKYLVQSTEIVSSAKEDTDGETLLFVSDDVKEYAQANHCFERSGAWQDSYIGSETQYEWREITDDQAKEFQDIINAYNKLSDGKWLSTIPGMVFKPCEWDEDDDYDEDDE